jgi:hypothetical protein
MKDLQKECSPNDLYTSCLNFICNNLNLVCNFKQNKLQNNKSYVNQPLNNKSIIPSILIPQKNLNLLSYQQQQQLLANLANHLTSLNSQNTTQCHELEFKDKNVAFNHILSEDLLEKLCDLGKLNDYTIALFNNGQTYLKKVHIKNASLTKNSLKQLLKNHQIEELFINGIHILSKPPHFSLFDAPNDQNIPLNLTNGSSFTLNDLLDSLNEWSLTNMKYLNVSRNTTLFSTILVNLKQFKNLQKLNVSFTSFNNLSLEIVTQDLENLEYLDVSGTRTNELKPLLNLKHKLKYLYMYNMRASLNDDIVPFLCNLPKLKHLDISCDVSTKIFADMNFSVFDVNFFLEELSNSMLMDLVYLDISGKNDIKQEILM